MDARRGGALNADAAAIDAVLWTWVPDPSDAKHSASLAAPAVLLRVAAATGAEGVSRGLSGCEGATGGAPVLTVAGLLGVTPGRRPWKVEPGLGGTAPSWRRMDAARGLGLQRWRGDERCERSERAGVTDVKHVGPT